MTYDNQKAIRRALRLARGGYAGGGAGMGGVATQGGPDGAAGAPAKGFTPSGGDAPPPQVMGSPDAAGAPPKGFTPGGGEGGPPPPYMQSQGFGPGVNNYQPPPQPAPLPTGPSADFYQNLLSGMQFAQPTYRAYRPGDFAPHQLRQTYTFNPATDPSRLVNAELARLKAEKEAGQNQTQTPAASDYNYIDYGGGGNSSGDGEGGNANGGRIVNRRPFALGGQPTAVDDYESQYGSYGTLPVDFDGGNFGAPDPGAPTGAPGTGNFGTDLAGFGEAVGPALGGAAVGAALGGPAGAAVGMVGGTMAQGLAEALGLSAPATSPVGGLASVAGNIAQTQMGMTPTSNPMGAIADALTGPPDPADQEDADQGAAAAAAAAAAQAAAEADNTNSMSEASTADAAGPGDDSGGPGGDGDFARGGVVGGRVDPRSLPGIHVKTDHRFAAGGATPDDDEEGFDAYHGSPYEFEQFDSSKIGTGEGAQAFGYGHYLAEEEPVARSYKSSVSRQKGKVNLLDKSGAIIPITEYAKPHLDSFLGGFGSDLRKADIDHQIKLLRTNWIPGQDKSINDYADAAEKASDPDSKAFFQSELEKIRKTKQGYIDFADALEKTNRVDPVGHMYHVRVKAKPEHFLDWDAPLSEQHPQVVQALDQAFPSAMDYWRSVEGKAGDNGGHFHAVASEDLTGSTKKGHQQISEKLQASGIPGIKYFDQNSRYIGKGTRNYVIFDPNMIKVKRRYADGGQITPPRDLDADPAVQQALDLTRNSNVSPVEAARSVAIGENYGGQDAPAYSQARPEAGGLPIGRGVSGSEGIIPSSHQAPLEGLPTRIKVPHTGEVITAGPNHTVRAVAEQYMRDAGLPYNPPTKYAKVDATRAKRIADEYERMADDPTHPLVKASYDALIKETMAQYQAAKAAGFQAEFWDPEKERDPYEASPRLAIEDVNKNHHMYVFPTYFGYGSKEVPADAAQKNPLLVDSGERWNGYPVTMNDIFRAVHDYFGHAKEGVGFRHDGEENAWRSHASMYSPLARLAMTSETRGQNSWLNFGPHGETNRNARTEDTVFADQKIGVMPPWTTHEGAEDFLRPEDREAMEKVYTQYRKARGGSIGYAAGGMPIDDPAVQQALDITRQAQPTAPQMAASVQPQAMPAMQSSPIQIEDHPAWIPTRFITSKKAVATPGQKDIVDLESMRQTPKLYQQNVDLVRAYPNTPLAMANVSHDDMAEHFIGHVKDNLLALHDAVPEEIRNRSKLWYDGARNIVDRWSKKYNLPDHSIAASLAALSPQKDWYQNVSLAERVLEAMRGQGGNFHRGFVFDDGMRNKFANIAAFQKPEYQNLLGILDGKTLHDLGNMPVDDDTKAAAKALWIRLHDETYNDRAHKIVTPEGDFGDFVKTQKGENAGTGWGSLTEIGKAIRSIEAAENPALISSLMGEKHKVRNFYNNILAPRSPHGDVTIDTHAVAAGLYRPLSGNSLEVAHNFANYAGKGMPSAAGSALTGIQGTYPLYAEAYRRAAKERGILPREMQSITWEAVRGLFPDTFKTAANNKKIDAVWNRYKNAEISQQDARGLINEITGGIRNPSWVVQGGTGPNEIGQASNDTGNISGRSLRGSSAEGIERGGRGKPAASVSARTRGPRPSPQIEEAASGGSIVDRALRLTSTNRPMVALADLFQRQLRGRPPS